MDAVTGEQFRTAYVEFTDPEARHPVRPQHQDKIDKAIAQGDTRVAKRLSKIYANWAASKAAGRLLRRRCGSRRPIDGAKKARG